MYLVTRSKCLDICPKVLKVVFLNDANLKILKGYKAYVQMNRQGEIHVIITGLSKDSSKNLFDNLEALNTADIMSDSK